MHQAYFALKSLEDCRRLAQGLANNLMVPMVIGLDGTLGAGKTQFTRFLAEALGADPRDVSSPTFVLVHRYATKPPMYHLDAYRVSDEDAFLDLGIEEMFEQPAVSVIEWSERVANCLPKDHLHFHFEWIDEHARGATMSASGLASQAILAKVRDCVPQA
jgi:tRNA threonylcarbamoyladenosine biosynthesis protein TsaE